MSDSSDSEENDYSSLLSGLSSTTRKYKKLLAKRKQEEHGESSSEDEYEANEDTLNQWKKQKVASDGDDGKGDGKGEEEEESDENEEERNGELDDSEEGGEDEEDEEDQEEEEDDATGNENVSDNDPFTLRLNHTLTHNEIASLSTGTRKFKKVETALREHIFVDDHVPSTQFSQGWKESNNAFIQQRLLNSYLTLKNKSTESNDKEEAESQQPLFSSLLQSQIFSMLSSYSDLYFSCRTIKNRKIITDAYVLHSLNHVFKTRNLVLKHNEKVKAAEEKGNDLSVDVRDQGYTRPKVLILLPFRNSAYDVVEKILAMVPEKHKKQILNRKRFQKEFGPQEEMKVNKSKPADFKVTFSGNHDDCFRIGIGFTNKSVKLYSPFYASDILIASPLGLKLIIGSEAEKERDFDFLSSIEVLIIDQADVFSMQNWDHMMSVISSMNQIPSTQRDTDFSRVRTWYLNGWAKHYRQTLLFSDYENTDLANLFKNHCANIHGGIRVRHEYKGVLSRIADGTRQLFHNIGVTSLKDEPEARFTYFSEEVLPQLNQSIEGHIMIFISSYFDFVRVRNLMKAKKASFCNCSEYTQAAEISRSRSMFCQGKYKFMLVTERFQFFRRYHLRGAKLIVFYSLPQNAIFYQELLNSMEAGDRTSIALLSKYDRNALERIVGSERCFKLLQSKKKTHMFC